MKALYEDDIAKLQSRTLDGLMDENIGLECDAVFRLMREHAVKIMEENNRGPGGVSLDDLRAANVERQKEWCPEQIPDLSFRGNELAGETGEACNVIKKLERERHGWRGSKGSVARLAEELADVVITADLVAIQAGIDLGAAVVAKFNATSEKNGLKTRLAGTSLLATVIATARELYTSYGIVRKTESSEDDHFRLICAHDDLHDALKAFDAELAGRAAAEGSADENGESKSGAGSASEKLTQDARP